ncbi:acyl-CoA synthetase family protein [Amycolatopsis samaneae]|uniref:AMP-dependent synthetase/ligase domain-containing protein n=1 Tax=Amycolatopsis samaneae TaxID=664691 RepID=A0ABW5GH75_9PSEU
MSQHDAESGLLATTIRNRADAAGERGYLEEAPGPHKVTYRGLADEVAGWLAALTAAAAPAGARVLLDVADPLVFAPAFLGVLAAGRCAVPVDPAASLDELTGTAALTGAFAIISDRPNHGANLGLRVLEPGPPGAGEPAGPGAVLTFSGPGAAEIPEHGLLRAAAATVGDHELTAADRGYCTLPLFRLDAQVTGLLATLLAGAALVLGAAVEPTAFWAVTRTRRVTWIAEAAGPLTVPVWCDEPVSR